MTARLVASVLSSFAVLMVASQDSYACGRTYQQLICPGDTVVSADSVIGTVVGVNAYQGTVAFRSKATGNMFTRSKSTLALGLGCLEMFCVGDSVVSDDSVQGIILAVNPYDSTVAFQSVATGNVFVRQLQTLALGIGCVQGVCVADTVISSDNVEGIVLATNPFQNTVAFQSKATGNVFVREATTLANAQYCDTYGEYSRSKQRYPFVNEKAYIDHRFKFAMKRPALKQ